MQSTGKWIPVELELPKAGDYLARVERDGETIEIKKRLIVCDGQSRWFGGCRPFADNDNVVAWFKSDDINVKENI